MKRTGSPLGVLLPLLVVFLTVQAARRASSAPPETPRIDYKFSFAPGDPPPGYTHVSPTTFYTKDPGYGFEEGAKATAVAGGGDRLHAGCCTSDSPFFFSAALPEGNYRVTVTLGNPRSESTTTIKSELRRLMLEQVHTDAGQFETRNFIANVRTPKIAGGGEVRLKAPRETVDEAWDWDEKLTLEFNGSHPAVCALEIARVDVPTVFILGDSTVCDQPKEPYASWGQMLPRFFKPDVAVANYAESGESLASSTSAHRLDKVLSVMKPGDYLLIQYGHNDMKSKAPDAVQTYKHMLKSWVEQVKQKGGTPILITSMNRHSFQGDTIVNSLKEYPETVREAAKEEGVPLIDLNAMSKPLYEALGPHDSVRLFKHDADDLTKFDGTHHSPYGAYELAKCVAQGIRQAKPELAAHLVEEVANFDPAKPDPAAEFKVPPSPGFTNQRPLGD